MGLYGGRYIGTSGPRPNGERGVCRLGWGLPCHGCDDGDDLFLLFVQKMINAVVYFYLSGEERVEAVFIVTIHLVH